MTQAVAVVRDGHAFQARQFWLKALCLLDPQSPIAKVGFETGPKGFDDIWVEYDDGRGRLDHRGNRLKREHYQCKWHVGPGDFTYEDLAQKDFINASSYSLLERALSAQRAHAPGGSGASFRLVTNWQIRHGDPLRQMVSSRHGFVRIDRLFDGTTDASIAGKIRKAWREHLGVDDAGLQLLASTLGLGIDSRSLLDLRDNLDPLLELRGMRRVPDSESTCWYDDLAYQWLAVGRIEFNRDEFVAACKQQNLFEAPPKKHVVFGVKSFEHPIDALEDRCVKVLNLLPHFNDRQIRDEEAWADELYPQLRCFLIDAAIANEHLRLVLDTHATLAFAAGSILNIKSGRQVELEQRVLNRMIWKAGDVAIDPNWPSWECTEETLSADESDLAVAVCLTHDITKDVRSYLRSSDTAASTLLVAMPTGGPGARVVASGNHAFLLAETLAQQIYASRTKGRKVHLFIAAPNTFTFMVGQRQPVLGDLILYEFDFDGTHGGSYAPSLHLPVRPAKKTA